MKKYYFFLFIGFLLSAQDHHVHTPWNLDGAKQRIDSIRKGNALIEFELNGQKFTDKTGQIQLDLDRHEFKFGVSMTQSRSFAQAAPYSKFYTYLDVGSPEIDAAMLD